MQYTKQQCQDFWKNATGNNSPENYLNTETTYPRSLYLLNKFEEYKIPKDYSILELGCNVGRNLNILYNAGWKSVSGVEINESALKLMEKQYPELAKNHFYCGSIEDYFCKFAHKYDVIFSMATLMHVPTESKLLFDLIRSYAYKYIITIEYESDIDSQHPYIWNHDYKRMLYEPNIWDLGGFENIDYILPNYFFRIFKRIGINRGFDGY